jgi:hypothetical protein
MNISQIEEKVKALIENVDYKDFLFNLLECYGKPKASITRLKMVGKGSYNLSKNPDEILWKKQVFFKLTSSDKLLSLIDEMKHEDVVEKHQPRFIIAINSTHLLAIDTKTEDTLDVALAELNKKFDFFLPWAGLEKAQAQNENPADVKAAEKMAKLFDLLRDNNPAITKQEIHAQNVFLSRILFCYFAEDTGIFEPNLFTNHVASHTVEDGSDLDDYLGKVFDVMNQEHRDGLPAYLTDFPYVNGGLFADKLPIPKFNRKSRAMLIECGSDLNWSEINPDIFGSMIQAVVHPDQRGNMGMHYTSVPNIMKVIEPLFLNELKEEFEKHADNKNKLELLLLRLEHLKIFDPACGSGNFLIIAYKELRQLEMEIFKRLQEISKEGLIPLSRIRLSQFYGIELDDFAHEVAILSLWLAEHQMNMKFKATFGHCSPALPLKSSGNVVCANATRISWNDVCPYRGGDEVYILGNPPYLGAMRQTDEQTDDLKVALGSCYASIDYIFAWFFKGAGYIKEKNARLAFVSTNSICQGEQVALGWPHLLSDGLEIDFCHTGFKWENNAKNKAAVIVIVIGMRNESPQPKYHISSGFVNGVKNINAYLAVADNVYVSSRSRPISNVADMCFGNMPADGGQLLLGENERESLLAADPSAAKFVKELISAKEFLNGQKRWCIWLDGISQQEIEAHPLIIERVDRLREIRKASSRPQLASIPHLFAQITQPKNASFILIPRHSSENRDYIPIGIFDQTYVAHDSCLIIPNGDAALFGILSSAIHMAWVKAVCGRIKADFRYSKDVVYNNYPFPALSDKITAAIANSALEVLACREGYPEFSLSDLYNQNRMPQDLKIAHANLDLVVDQAYRAKPFIDEAERLSFLFNLYQKRKEALNA